MTKILYVGFSNENGLAKRLKVQGFEVDNKLIKTTDNLDSIANMQEANDLFRIDCLDKVKNYNILIVESGIILNNQINHILEDNPNTTLVVVYPYPNYKVLDFLKKEFYPFYYKSQ